MAGSSFLDSVFRRRKKKSTDFITTFEFDFDNIRAATNDFSDLVGRGGAGSVYKGRLQSGQEIAVKRLSETSLRKEREFHKEINLLSKLRHKNLINLLGFCSKRDQYFLVYEFMPNSSLDHFIFDPNRGSQLNWGTCRNIIQGIARGLRYLHEESGLCVVHRDINPTNILLDSNSKPKIAGFGVAMLVRESENEGELSGIAGTIGYLDPEYFRTGRVSVKSDVYAFGVTILNIISRRRAIMHSEEEPLIIDSVKRCLNRGDGIDVIHEVMREEERRDSIIEILRYIHIALLCTNENAETRPSIDQVLHWFSCFSTPLPEPIPTTGDPYFAEANSNRSLSLGHNSVISDRSLSPSLSSARASHLTPENIQRLCFSVKSDVYAFGVTILEIISRRRPFGDGEEPLIKNVLRCWNRGEAINVIYEVMREEEKEDSISEILRYIHIALLCVDDNPRTRPSFDKLLRWFSCFSSPLPETIIGYRYLAEDSA